MNILALERDLLGATADQLRRSAKAEVIKMSAGEKRDHAAQQRVQLAVLQLMTDENSQHNQSVHNENPPLRGYFVFLSNVLMVDTQFEYPESLFNKCKLLPPRQKDSKDPFQSFVIIYPESLCLSAFVVNC